MVPPCLVRSGADPLVPGTIIPSALGNGGVPVYLLDARTRRLVVRHRTDSLVQVRRPDGMRQSFSLRSRVYSNPPSAPACTNRWLSAALRPWVYFSRSSLYNIEA
ncbi:hypothetical protein STH1416 [Symbiobacterium thermophilum IAM 14863]|uniref:Uncharacterized protein n=1 Tax=Symbiobacterium thermophilum (strain DSM 24528 / JCM 14929 / IAM 14863 / T) TaxID=292459 RepID=Q67PJ2_SYMTH|nr:hypothetical protein STH1416 [Symbiobacterium thermophilum IAM 14863]